MKKMMIVMSTTGLMTLSACMGGGDTVTRGKDTGAQACPGMTGVSAAHLQSVDGMAVRCGPQTQSPVTYAN